MLAWKIAKKQFALERAGEGARLTGGRWNSPGIEVIYAGMTPEISAMEKLVHTSSILPTDLVLVRIELPDDQALFCHFDISNLPEGWDDLPGSSIAMQIGDAFVQNNQYLGMIVPSVVIPESSNIVINPNHPAFAFVQMTVVRPFEFDSRIR